MVPLYRDLLSVIDSAIVSAIVSLIVSLIVSVSLSLSLSLCHCLSVIVSLSIETHCFVSSRYLNATRNAVFWGALLAFWNASQISEVGAP
eukprot:COSAG03_NODE_22883_length_285_cov_7.801075_1_plen_89_part_01